MKKVLFLLSFVAIALIAISCSGEVKSTTSEPETKIDALTTKDFYRIIDGVQYRIKEMPGWTTITYLELPRADGTSLLVSGVFTTTTNTCTFKSTSITTSPANKELKAGDKVEMTWILDGEKLVKLTSIKVNDVAKNDELLAMNRFTSLSDDFQGEKESSLLKQGGFLVQDLKNSFDSNNKFITIKDSSIKVNGHTVTVSSTLKPAWIVDTPTDTTTYTDYDALRVFSVGFEDGVSLDYVTVLKTTASDCIYFDRYGKTKIDESFWTVSSVGISSIIDAIKLIEDVLNVKLTVTNVRDSLFDVMITGIEVNAMDLAVELSIANTKKDRSSVIKLNISNSNLINIFQAPIYDKAISVQTDSLKLNTTLSVSGSWVLNNKEYLSIDGLTLTINSDDCDDSLKFRDAMGIDEVYYALMDNFDYQKPSVEFDAFKKLLGVSNLRGTIALNGTTYPVKEIYNVLTCL